MSRYIFIQNYNAKPIQGGMNDAKPKSFVKGDLVDGEVWDRRSAGGDAILVLDGGFYNILIDSVKNGNKNSPIRQYTGTGNPKPLSADATPEVSNPTTAVNPPVIEIGNWFTIMSFTNQALVVLGATAVVFYAWRHYKKKLMNG